MNNADSTKDYKNQRVFNRFFKNNNFSVIISKNAQIDCYNNLKNCKIGSSKLIGNYIIDSTIGDNCKIMYSTIESSNVKDSVQVGVYSHLRPDSNIDNCVRIGNFVETKKCDIGKNTKVAHLTYVGDATLGQNVNVGCGTVFCNYNGKIKQHTSVGDNVFIGSNSNLVAPIIVSSDSFIAAGSTITKDVPTKCLAIARSRQINKEDYL